LAFLERYHKDGNEFLNHIIRVTGVETWVSFVNLETKQQSKQWMHTHSPNKPKKFKQMLSACQKADATVFWDRKEVLMLEFMQQGITITSKVYCKMLRKLCRDIQNKRHEMLTYSLLVVLLSMATHIHIQLLALEHCQSISTGSCLTTLFTALTLF
jgi:hypothetical protein